MEKEREQVMEVIFPREVSWRNPLDPKSEGLAVEVGKAYLVKKQAFQEWRSRVTDEWWVWEISRNEFVGFPVVEFNVMVECNEVEIVTQSMAA